MNQSNGEVEGAEENSIAVAAPVGGGANAPVQAMTFTRWMSMRLDTFDGSRMPLDAADRPRMRWSGEGCWAQWSGAAMGAGRSGEDGSILNLTVCTSKQELESATLLNSIL